MSQGTPAKEGVLLIAIFLNASLFGLVSQQFYAYWASRFKDPMYLKVFVTVQFIGVGLQTILMWHFAYMRFILFNVYPLRPKPDLWEGPVNSICQLIVILLANMFLAIRIYSLTSSRVQSGLVVVLSITAFVIGMITVVMTWKNTIGRSGGQIASVFWHAIQAIAECLITFFLTRVLVMSRSGMPKSDTMVNYLVRSVIQTGCLATTWALAALVTWFFLSNNLVYRIFDLTSGTVYTHAIFETLIERIRLREQMSTPTYEFGWATQDRPGLSVGASEGVSIVQGDDIELQALPVRAGKLLSPPNYEPSRKPHGG
ncbi:hypothetical protein F5148DRAFT_64684 [Russula earlei]|uniref:Uncharacterized protein n=1 Tax=Russula earlei TaxID=71964 RepID=A0ACC0U8A1_9AGAM|nr:hypothetical protein F5148DRAFT_64684 [Russula earlei]